MLPSLEDYFLTSTLLTSFKDLDITSIDNLFIEFIRLDNDQAQSINQDYIVNNNYYKKRRYLALY